MATMMALDVNLLTSRLQQQHLEDRTITAVTTVTGLVLWWKYNQSISVSPLDILGLIGIYKQFEDVG